jgi:hypothetical protein
MDAPDALPGLPEPVLSEPATASNSGLRYWTPVLLLMVLFAQVMFLGLRPALAEHRRLVAAEDMLFARLELAQSKRNEVQLHFEARLDPVFQERQRRWRLHPTEAE